MRQKKKGAGRKVGMGLLKHPQFVEARNERVRVAEDPAEENWKKALALKDILQLYQPQPQGKSPASQYQRSEFEEFHQPQKPPSDREEMQTEEGQILKYTRMADGVASWEQIYAKNYLERANAKIPARPTTQHQPRVSQKVKAMTGRGKKQNMIGVAREKRLFQKLVGSLDNKPRFTVERAQVKELKEQSQSQFGVNFARYPPPPNSSISLTQLQQTESRLLAQLTRSETISNGPPKPTSTNILNTLLRRRHAPHRSIPITIPSSSTPHTQPLNNSQVKYIRVG